MCKNLKIYRYWEIAFCKMTIIYPIFLPAFPSLSGFSICNTEKPVSLWTQAWLIRYLYIFFYDLYQFSSLVNSFLDLRAYLKNKTLSGIGVSDG